MQSLQIQAVQPAITSIESPPLSAVSFGQALTPDYSEPSDSPGFPPPRLPIGATQEQVVMEMDVEQDLFSSPSIPVLPPSGRPARLDPKLFQQDVHGGRVPTPMFNTFTAHPFRPRNDTMFDECSSPRTTSAPKPFDRPHRMPSPISEDDTDEKTMQTSSQLSRLSVTEESMDMEGIEIVLPPLRKGRSRSGAITIEKRRFSMGFRDDCEKCQMKLPGHYAHFLPI
jgi:hypothetical protein